MSKIPTWRNCLSVCADIIQVTTAVGITVAGTVAVLFMLISWLSEVPPIWIAVATLTSGLSTLFVINNSTRRKSLGKEPDEKERFLNDLRHRAHLNRLALTGKSPQYAPPEKESRVPISLLSIKDIGSQMIELAHHINSFVEHEGKNKSEQDLVNGYHTRFASDLIHLYEEAERRGHQDADIKQYYEHPESLVNARHIAARIGAMGHRLQLYIG